MQQLQSHYRWFQSFRHLRMSAFLVVALMLFAFTNAALLMLAKVPEDVQAQTPTTSIEVNETPKEEAVPVEPEKAPEITTPPPAPQPAQVRVATPAPAYDKVSIPSIGLSSRFVTVGTTATNNIDVHPSLVGWWNGSAQLGSPGAAFLDGHNPGVFSGLPAIQVGAEISVSRASGEVYNYTVVHVETVQLLGINMNKVLRTYGGASEGLNLMTCVGAYNPQTNTTDQRLVVYAVRS